MSRRARIPTVELSIADLSIGDERKIGAAAVKAMGTDLAAHGLRAPIVVAVNPERPEHPVVIDGVKRVLAARTAGWKKILGVVLPAGRAPEAQKAIAAIVTKLALGELADHELARAAIGLRETHHVPAAVLADILGRSRGYTCNLVRWWESVSETIRKAWQTGHPAMTQAELERLSKMGEFEAEREWERLLSAGKGTSWAPGKKPPVAARPKNGLDVRIAELDEAIRKARLKPPVKSFVRSVLGFLMGRNKGIPGVTDRRHGLPKEIRS